MEESFMSPEEVAVCTQIASGEPPYNQRAQALLTLAAGASQAEAAAQSGLTENQVRYWWGRFRSRRLAVFPEALLTAVPEPAPMAATLDEVITEAAGSVVIEESATVASTAVAAKSKKKKKAASKKQKKGQKEKGKKKGTKKKKKKEGKKKSDKKKEGKKKKSGKKGGKGKSKGSKKKTRKK